VFDGSDKIYEWLKSNGPAHGFVRTVSRESVKIRGSIPLVDKRRLDT